MRFIATLLPLLFGVLPAVAQETDADRVVRFVAELETEPLTAESVHRRAWLLEWVTQTKDYTVVVCEILGPVPGANVPYSPEVVGQQIFGNVAYQIKNPGAVDPVLAQVAGVESALRAYSQILKQDANARIAYFDELVSLQQRGGLAQHMTPIIMEKCSTDGAG